ncbi:MAG TPA: ATP-dependent helicase [Candidatus Gemmiger excrementigallinarum]|uniref:DNA 3'-5' helicase n=1 Tax=Candidatus Gemmiger excrementigallinarum TaxID=2838609 RepID=A0A9D2ESN4_9FIRM|nr:ATP-dependent helicase [Candidatus Gemmiger excrementigallinarum]
MEEQQFFEQHLASFNPQQQAAVTAVDGPVLLLAVPGSGKTTVLVTRLGYMVQCRGIPPESILTMTYTVAATREMRNRFAARFGAALADRMQFRTINGVAAKVLQYYSYRYNRQQPELMTNEGELTRMLTWLYQQVSDDYPTESTLKELRTAITYIKNMALDEEGMAALETDLPDLPRLYRSYQAELKRRGWMDYDDQMVFALQILRAVPAVLAHFQDQYRYLCVDESQDTSKIQHEIIALLAGRSRNLFMVGDEDQSIYGFRAAYPQALMEFEKVWPAARVLLMERNYRSGSEIVDAANHFVAHNRYRRPKVMQATCGDQGPLQIVPIRQREDQFTWLFDRVQQGERLAVLFRNNESALPLIDLCERHSLAYCFPRSELTFFTDKIVLDVADFFHFARHPGDRTLFMRLYYKFGLPISRRLAEAACAESIRTGRPIPEALLRNPDLSRRVQTGMKDAWWALKRLPQQTAAEALETLRDSVGYGAYLEQKKMDSGKLSILGLLAEQEPTPERLLERLAELRALLAEHTDPEKAPLTLSTIHSSKGLEYDSVVLLDAFDGILPAQLEICCRTAEDTRRYEEDRRLYYVAMTRARNRLVLFDCPAMPSVFTQEVLFNLPEARARREQEAARTARLRDKVSQIFAPSATVPAPKLPPVDLGELSRVGAAVEHAVFGRGTVTDVNGRFLTIRFADGKERRLDGPTVAEHHLLQPVK